MENPIHKQEAVPRLSEPDPKKDNREFIFGIFVFCSALAVLNLIATLWNPLAYYYRQCDGTVIRVTWRDFWVLDDGREFSNPVDQKKLFPSLKPVEPGDVIEKRSGSMTLFVNGKVYFDNGMAWRQAIHSDSLIFLIISICGAVCSSILVVVLQPGNAWKRKRGPLDRPRSSRDTLEREKNCVEFRFHSTEERDAKILLLIMTSFLALFTGLLSSVFLPFTFAAVLGLCVFTALCLLILRAGVDSLTIDENGVVVVCGAWLLRSARCLPFEEIAGVKVERDASRNHSAIQLILKNSKPVALWDDMKEEEAEALSLEITDACKRFRPEIVLLEPTRETAGAGNYRSAGKLLITGALFLVVCGVVPWNTSKFGEILWWRAMFWSVLYGVCPFVCGWIMKRGDRSGVAFSFLLAPSLFLWTIPVFHRHYPSLTLPYFGLASLLVAVFAGGVGLWAWGDLPTSDETGRRIPVLRISSVPFLLLAAGASFGLWKCAEAKGELLSAVQSGDAAKTERMLSSPFASLKLTGERRRTLVHLAVLSGNPGTLEKVLEAGADPNVKSQNVNYPVHLAAKANRTDMVKTLVARGADINARDLYDKTILHIAAERGNAEMAEFVLNNGANPVARNSSGATPVIAAAASGDEKIVKKLLEHGADLNVKDNYGNTPLIEAARKGRTNMVLFLLRNGGTAGLPALDAILSRKTGGISNVFLACALGKAEIVAKLLKQCSNALAMKDDEGYTPLHWAAWSGNRKLIEALLRYGFDKRAKTKNGFTPKDVAKARGNAEAVRDLY